MFELADRPVSAVDFNAKLAGCQFQVCQLLVCHTDNRQVNNTRCWIGPRHRPLIGAYGLNKRRRGLAAGRWFQRTNGAR